MKLFSKHGLLLIAAIALLLPAIAACGGDDEDDSGDTDDATEEVEETDDEAAEEDEEAATDEEEEPTEEEMTEEEPTEEEEMAEEEPTEEEAAEDEEATEEEGDDEAAGGEGGEITIGFIEGWSEGVAASYLWGALLEDQGYTVNMEPIAEAGILYQGIAAQDIDLYVAAWLPLTHESYWTENEEDLEHIGTWYEEALLALAVPQYVADEHGVESLEDLADNADLFDSTITGIEPGAGMMGIAADSVMPTYGLEDWELLESSTAAMLTEWESAYENEEPIVVTLWEPHWAYSAWDIHNLEDPEGAWGELDQMQVVGWSGFSEEFPEASGWLSNFELESSEIGELMDYVTVQAEDGEQMEYAQQWLEDGGQDIADEWMN